MSDAGSLSLFRNWEKARRPKVSIVEIVVCGLFSY